MLRLLRDRYSIPLETAKVKHRHKKKKKGEAGADEKSVLQRECSNLSSGFFFFFFFSRKSRTEKSPYKVDSFQGREQLGFPV